MTKTSSKIRKSNASLPEALYKGTAYIGSDGIECYVLSSEERVMSYRQAVKLITGTDSGQLGDYVGVSALKSLISNEKVAGETINFRIKESDTLAKGLRAETFADICKAYVEAAYTGLLTTNRQKEIALRCSFLQSSFTKIGVVSLIDEVTGYEKIKAADAYSIKLKAYIAEQTRKWEKTFPDQYYMELSRLCGYSDWRIKRPHYAQITRKVYRMVDADVAAKLIDMDKNPNVDQHQYLSTLGKDDLKEKIGRVIGIASVCLDIREFNQKMKLFQPGGCYQLDMFPAKIVKCK